MVRGRYLTSKDDISDVISIRRRVFVDEQGYSADSEPDDRDNMAIYALVTDGENAPSATGRLYIDDDKFWIGRVCVLQSARGKRLGDLVMRMLLFRALELGANAVHISAQLPKLGFYARYGFEPYGEIVYDEGVEHRLMKVERDDIDIAGVCDGDCEACKNG